jgi:hypothetical protein
LNCPSQFRATVCLSSERITLPTIAGSPDPPIDTQARCKCGPGAHPRILRIGRHQQSLDAQRHKPTGHERAGVPSRIEVGADDCRSGGGGADSSCTSGRGDPPSVGREGRGEKQVMREVRNYLRSRAQGLSDEDVVHKVMCRALEYQAELSTLKSKEPPRPGPPHRYGQR